MSTTQQENLAASPPSMPHHPVNALACASGAGNRPLLGILSWLAVATGVIFQLHQYLPGRSLWMDEVFVALNLRYLSRAELSEKLHFDQMAPLGWLHIEKMLDGVTGLPEYDMRIASLFAGISFLFLFRALSLRVLSELGALTAILLASSIFIVAFYASALKPYIFDLAIATLIMFLGMKILQTREIVYRDVFFLALLAVLSPVFSFPSIFVLGAVGIFLVTRWMINRQYWPSIILIIAGGASIITFAYLLSRVYWPQSANTTLTTGVSHEFFVKVGFAPFPLKSLADVIWFLSWFKESLKYFFAEGRFPVALFMMIGAYHLAKRSPWILLLLFTPIVLALIASGLKLYPVHERLLLFYLPALILLAGAGVEFVLAGSQSVIVPSVLVALMVGPTYFNAIQRALQSDATAEDIRPALKILAEKSGSEDLIFLQRAAVPYYLFYRSEYGLREAPWATNRQLDQSWACVLPQLQKVKPAGTVWVLTLFFQGKPSHKDLEFELPLHGLRAEKDFWPLGHFDLYKLRLMPEAPQGENSSASKTAREDCRELPMDTWDWIPARILARANNSPR
jgi:hypothetical protein